MTVRTMMMKRACKSRTWMLSSESESSIVVPTMAKTRSCDDVCCKLLKVKKDDGDDEDDGSG